jgi:hypothetical protein
MSGYKSGKIYDIDEPSRLREQLAEQDKIFASIEKEKAFSDNSLIRYSIIGAGVVIILVIFRQLIKK